MGLKLLDFSQAFASVVSEPGTARGKVRALLDFSQTGRRVFSRKVSGSLLGWGLDGLQCCRVGFSGGKWDQWWEP